MKNEMELKPELNLKGNKIILKEPKCINLIFNGCTQQLIGPRKFHKITFS